MRCPHRKNQTFFIGVTLMKRLHVSVSVDSIDASVDFYSTLFGAAPSVIKSDYAKWMLDAPRVNVVVENAGRHGALTTLVSKSTRQRNWLRLPNAWQSRKNLSSNRRQPLVATQSPTKPGRPIRRAWLGRRSTRLAKAQPTATRRAIPVLQSSKKAPPRVVPELSWASLPRARTAR